MRVGFQTGLKMFETFGGLNVVFLSWNITFLQSFIPCHSFMMFHVMMQTKIAQCEPQVS
jgi:hypothetical protein